ncbi:MAG: tRNA (guanosine(37)-N1)-methyltransferase TrmD [Spirochaetota bacterium]|nr:MAG: tRNA (guanosine(37)-N1)-methyltransferase TrmD [Spirochaetota bacterium]
MLFTILALFPDTVSCFFQESIVKRAIDSGVVSINLINIRDYTKDKHGKVDDYPFGGGRGMVLAPDPIFRAFESIRNRGYTIALSPMGCKLNQEKVRELSILDSLTILCGHYEGIDHRVVESLVDEEISIGDFVLTGGEPAACVIVDCITRELEGVLGDDLSKCEESFDRSGLLEYEQYTRPAEYRGMSVPEVLLSGNHERIRKWRMKRRLLNTLEKRPDLINRSRLSGEYRELLHEIEKEKSDESS